ncbi:hypothetical protein PP175_07230 [Aneurinibacillus sp. Ricciae_BoGa-3]|uniref:hypothetical protein n=1 Tax=Aneurinibacillus sp. Ricciae_BoGa-3 TaxID=3022697 RepID=UPI00233F9880|nr:hypothetical protein [Aneurinibacillus sp. Ricciae_BoGa-3]WCK55727.1 hypothetical protein PP175_07230 [Aneurinibacillus sp. Ricciae_BoGa-3]
MNISSTSSTQLYPTSYPNPQNSSTTGQKAQLQADGAKSNEGTEVKKGHHGHHGHHARATKAPQQVENTSTYSATPAQTQQTASSTFQSSTIDFTA